MLTRIRLSWPSVALLRPVEVHIGLPSPLAFTPHPYKCVWALHCAMEDGEFFFNTLDCGSLVEKEKIAFVAPSLGNGYYINSGFEAHADFLDELLAQLPTLLPLSPKKEDNSVIGVSMGGFGALRWALASGKFQHVAAISGVFDCHVPVDERLRRDRRLKALHLALNAVMRKCLLEEGESTRKEADLAALAGSANVPAPVALYCGEQDYISLNQTLWLEKTLQAASIPVELCLMPGSHGPQFWKEAFRMAVMQFCKEDQADASH